MAICPGTRSAEAQLGHPRGMPGRSQAGNTVQAACGSGQTQDIRLTTGPPVDTSIAVGACHPWRGAHRPVTTACLSVHKQGVFNLPGSTLLQQPLGAQALPCAHGS